MSVSTQQRLLCFCPPLTLSVPLIYPSLCAQVLIGCARALTYGLNSIVRYPLSYHLGWRPLKKIMWSNKGPPSARNDKLYSDGSLSLFAAAPPSSRLCGGFKFPWPIFGGSRGAMTNCPFRVHTHREELCFWTQWVWKRIKIGNWVHPDCLGNGKEHWNSICVKRRIWPKY